MSDILSRIETLERLAVRVGELATLSRDIVGQSAQNAAMFRMSVGAGGGSTPPPAGAIQAYLTQASGDFPLYYVHTGTITADFNYGDSYLSSIKIARRQSIASDTMYLTGNDTWIHQINRDGSNSRWVDMSTAASGLGTSAIVLDSSGNIFILMVGSYSKLYKVTASGTVTAITGSITLASGSLSSIAIDASSNIYMLGSYQIGPPYVGSYAFRIYLWDGTALSIFYDNASSAGVTQKWIQSIACNSSGVLHAVSRARTAGNASDNIYIDKISGSGSVTNLYTTTNVVGDFYVAGDIAFDSSDNVYTVYHKSNDGFVTVTMDMIKVTPSGTMSIFSSIDPSGAVGGSGRASIVMNI